MNCERFAEALIEQLEGTLGVAESASMRAHAIDCQDCRALQTAAIQGRAPVAVPGDLIATVMEATTGNACARAQHLASEQAGASLRAVDEALETHLQSCPECRRLRLALDRLCKGLPQLAELQPDDDFVDQVMAMTTRLRRPSRWERFARRPRSRWEAFVRRPRLALEGAYAGTLALFLVVGFPAAPFAGVPPRLLTELGQQRLVVREVVVTRSSQLATTSSRTWIESKRRLAAYVDVCPPRGSASRGFTELAQCWRQASEQKLARSWRDQVEPFIETVRRLQRWVTGFLDSGDLKREPDNGTIDTSA